MAVEDLVVVPYQASSTAAMLLLLHLNLVDNYAPLEL